MHLVLGIAEGSSSMITVTHSTHANKEEEESNQKKQYKDHVSRDHVVNVLLVY
jgi:hypothetical protein